MIRAFIDRGDAFRDAPASLRRLLDEQFLLYLLHATKFRDVLATVNDNLDEDTAYLKPLVKVRLTEMIDDPTCNTYVKPSVLRLIAGDKTGFRAMRVSTSRTAKIIARHEKAFVRRLKALEFDVSEIGPQQITRLELEYLDKVRQHSKNFAQYKARFLITAEHGLSLENIVSDLQMVGLRTFRWYYPFRTGLHMTNSMRRAITNRGNSLIKYNVADVRRRLIMLDSGEMYNRESSGDYDAALNSSAGSVDYTRAIDLSLDVMRLSEKGYSPGVLDFVRDPQVQDRFIGWYSAKCGKQLADMVEVSRRITLEGDSYTSLLAEFLEEPREGVRAALKALRMIAA